MAKSVGRYLGLHRWVRKRTDDGQWYKECRRCGKFLDKTSHGRVPVV